jgi:hypothetical protein
LALALAVACSKRLPNKAYQHVWPKIRTRDSEDIPCIFPVMQGIGVAAICKTSPAAIAHGGPITTVHSCN